MLHMLQSCEKGSDEISRGTSVFLEGLKGLGVGLLGVLTGAGVVVSRR